MDIVLGESWPSSREPEDHDFWNRESQTGNIEIEIELSGKAHEDRYGYHEVNSIIWKYYPNDPEYKVISKMLYSLIE